MRKFLPRPLADGLRRLEQDRAQQKAADRAQKAEKRKRKAGSMQQTPGLMQRTPANMRTGALPGETTNRVLDRGNR